MRRLFLAGVSLFAISACVPEPAPPPAAAIAAPGYGAVPPGSGTTFFDGVYNGSFVQNVSAPGSQCPNYPVAPVLTIYNGVARFAALDLNFQGYVTPQGQLNIAGPDGPNIPGTNKSLLCAQRPSDRELRI